ncbi:MAG: cyclic nucleotide-binding domain-containing protein [Myxococcota bacterium]
MSASDIEAGTVTPRASGPDAVTPATLTSSGLFSGLDADLLGGLARRLSVVSFASGDLIFSPGDPGRELYLIVEGQVTLRAGERDVAHLEAGDWFGDVAPLDLQPRPVAAVGAAPGVLARCSLRDLDWLYRTSPRGYALVVLNVAREHARRLRKAWSSPTSADPPVESEPG